MIDQAAQRWMDLDPEHPAIARAFQMPQNADGARFALYPFRVDRIEGTWHVLAAWPCPRTIGALDTDHSGIVSVIAWNPQTNAFHTVGDAQPQLVGRVDRDFSAEATLYGQPLAFFRAWIANRLAYWRFIQAGGPKAHGLGPEPDLVPGALVVGDFKHIRLPVAHMPLQVGCVGINPGAVNRSIQNIAKLPQATAKAQSVGAAA